MPVFLRKKKGEKYTMEKNDQQKTHYNSVLWLAPAKPLPSLVQNCVPVTQATFPSCCLSTALQSSCSFHWLQWARDTSLHRRWPRECFALSDWNNVQSFEETWSVQVLLQAEHAFRNSQDKIQRNTWNQLKYWVRGEHHQKERHLFSSIRSKFDYL